MKNAIDQNIHQLPPDELKAFQDLATDEKERQKAHFAQQLANLKATHSENLEENDGEVK